MKDIHFHIMEPYALVPPADFPMPTMDNARYIARALDALGLRQACIPAISLYDEVDAAANPLALYAKTLAPGRVYALAGLRYGLTRERNAALPTQAKALYGMGFDGFKMICKPNVRRAMKFSIDDPMFDAFFSEAEENGWPILYHVGDPDTFWDPARAPGWAKENGWYYADDQDVPSPAELYDETERMLQKHPRLRVTFAHFFFLSERLDRAQSLLDRYPFVFLDVTPGSEMYRAFSAQPEESRRFFERNRGRILFGTDSVAANGAESEKALSYAEQKIARMKSFFERGDAFASSWGDLSGLGLSDAALSMLYEGAFDRFLGHPAPRKVDCARAAALCDMLAAQASAAFPEIRALLAALKRAFESTDHP